MGEYLTTIISEINLASKLCGNVDTVECAGNIRACPFRERAGKGKYCNLAIFTDVIL